MNPYLQPRGWTVDCYPSSSVPGPSTSFETGLAVAGVAASPVLAFSPPPAGSSAILHFQTDPHPLPLSFCHCRSRRHLRRRGNLLA